MYHESVSKDSLIPLLVKLYEEIREIEIEHDLWAGRDDFRPRIERFHDAIRAYTSGVSPYEKGSRLRIEYLAKDLEMLRTIQMNPMAKFPGTERGMAGKDVMFRANIATGSEGGDKRRSARGVRSELAGRYQQYAVMFAALLAETADMNHQERMEDRDLIIEELENLKHAAQGLSSMDLRHLAGEVITDPELAALIASMMPEGVLAKATAEHRISYAQNRIDMQQKKLEEAHIVWLSNQRALYHDGREVVTQLMQHGLNMAGKFLQQAMTQGMGGHGRGF